MNDTIRPGVTIGIPGSGQRIADLAEFYSNNDIESPFDPTTAVSYAAERITTNLPPTPAHKAFTSAYVYTSKRIAISLEG